MLILLIFIAIPIIEITLFIQVGGTIGLYPTLGIVILTAIIGSTLLKSQGLTALGTLQNSIKSGQNPMKQIVHGAMILVSGVLLLTSCIVNQPEISRTTQNLYLKIWVKFLVLFVKTIAI